jgi:hypothetical protein
MGYILPKNAASIKLRAVQPRPFSMVLSSFGRLNRGLEGGFSHRRRQDYYMNYYMRGGQVEAGGARLDWVLASDTSTSEEGRASRFSSSIC